MIDSVMADLLAGTAAANVGRNRNYRKDGRVIDCEWYNSIVRDEAGRVVSVLSRVLDVTDRTATSPASGPSTTPSG